MSKHAALPHWIDERIPEAAFGVLARAGVNADEFASWLGPALGRYRSEMHLRDNMPARADQLDALRRLQAPMSEAAKALRNLPQGARAELVTLAWRAERPELVERLADDLGIASVLIGAAVSRTAAAKARRGRKPGAIRDILLAECVKKLRSSGVKGAERVRGIAAELLDACHVPSPTDDSRIRRAVTRGRKKVG